MRLPTDMFDSDWRTLRKALPGVYSAETGGGIVTAMMDVVDRSGEHVGQMMFMSRARGGLEWTFVDDEGQELARGRLTVDEVAGRAVHPERRPDF